MSWLVAVDTTYYPWVCVCSTEEEARKKFDEASTFEQTVYLCQISDAKGEDT